MASNNGRRLLYAVKRAADVHGKILSGAGTVTVQRPVSCLTSVRCLSTTKATSSEFYTDQASFSDEIPRVRGIDILRDPKLNKGMGFKLKERQILGIHGLLPPAVFTQKEQATRVYANIEHWTNNLDKYIYLSALHDRNEKLFYRILRDNIEDLAPVVYTPTVGLACQQFGFIFRRPKGLYITINDAGHVYDVIRNWPEPDVKAIVVTDGERILGLGDLGAFGMGIPIGKLSLYTAMGGVYPHQCLPVMLDVGTDNDDLIESPMYIGLRHKRVRGHAYDDFIEEFMMAVKKRWGQDTLIQFEDFANHNAFRLLDRYKNRFLTFNDDIQGTAAVVVAGLIAATKETNVPLGKQNYLFLGAGEAAIGIASLLTKAMEEEGLETEEAASRIWMVDVHGLLTKNRPKGKISAEQELFAKDHEPMDNLEEICRKLKPNVALGAAAATGAFTKQFLEDMASFNERPVIFALSNPTSKAECTAEEAYTHTNGRCIFASGSPFDKVTLEGKTYIPGQGNNSYIFPGVALGAIVSGAYHLDDKMFLRASQALAEMVTPNHLAEGRVYPPLSDILEVSTRLATRIVEEAYERGIAAHYPEPADKEKFVREHMYSTAYGNMLPETYPWPGMIE